MARRPGLALPVAAALLVALPPLSSLLEATMTGHMLLQIPLLVVCGWVLGNRLLDLPSARLRALSPLRWALLVVAAATLGVWMIPRLLDLAVASAGVDLAKALTLALAGGLPLRLAWAGLGPVARGIVHVEALASLWRLAWIYLDSPARLCSQYGLADQQRLGRLLLQAGALYALWLAWRALARVPAAHPTRSD
ncbi:MAG: hypothetical protein KF788_06125 [Piscinibacter sp.]|nr:hypothetical protein [Piscinibacter sp.]